MAKSENALCLHICRSKSLKIPGLLALVVFALLPASAEGGTPRKPLGRYEFSLPRMGTVFRIILYAQDQVTASKASTAAFERVEQLEQIFSDYREDSELSRLSRTAARAPQPASKELYSVLEESLRISELSGGAFDVSIGPVVVLWREARRAKRLPDAARLAEAKLAVGYQNIVLDPQEHTAFLKRDDMRLDLGGIAKGFAGDAALEVLQSQGIRSSLVDAGGDVSIGDAPPGQPGWRVNIRKAGPTSALPDGGLILHNVAIATSGDALQYVESHRRRFSHIINPPDGLGIRDSVSTTVIAPRGATADGLATALSILPVPEGLKLVESLEKVSAFLVRHTGKGLQFYASRRFPIRVANTQLQANQGISSHH
jgi:thiamine biosynthesis lipoprotein